MAVTINDVAKEAGVSITTVSRVVNNNYPVKKETREAIEKAIEKLNYKPNMMARGLITKKTSLIGVVVPGITNLFFSTIVEGIESNIKTKGYRVALCNTGGDYKEEKRLIEDIVSRQIDGIIVIDPTYKNLENDYFTKLSKKVPIIIVNGKEQNNECNFVCYNEEVGTVEAFEHLTALEHKKIAFVRGKRSFSYDIKENVYKKILEQKGIEYKKIIDVGYGNSIYVTKKTEKEMEKLLKSEERPTAIFACNDIIAVGVINACNKVGLRVPEDISIVSCDNTLLANVTYPKLTSIDLRMAEIGENAAFGLLEIIENKNVQKRVVIETNLVSRSSTAMNKLKE